MHDYFESLCDVGSFHMFLANDPFSSKQLVDYSKELGEKEKEAVQLLFEDVKDTFDLQ